MVRYLSSLGAVLVLPFTWCKFTLTMSSLSRVPDVLRSSKETHGLGIMSGEGYHGTIVSLLSYQKVKGNFEILPLYQTDLFLIFSLQYVSFSSARLWILLFKIRIPFMSIPAHDETHWQPLFRFQSKQVNSTKVDSKQIWSYHTCASRDSFPTTRIPKLLTVDDIKVPTKSSVQFR